MTIAARPGELWVSDEHARSLYGLDPRSLALERRLRLPDRPRDIAIAGEAVWVATDRGRLVAIDPRSAETIRSVDLGGGSLSHVAAGGGAIWVTSYEDDAVFGVDATDLQPRELELHQPAGIAVNGRQVWLSAVDEKRRERSPVTPEPDLVFPSRKTKAPWACFFAEASPSAYVRQFQHTLATLSPRTRCERRADRRSRLPTAVNRRRAVKDTA